MSVERLAVKLLAFDDDDMVRFAKHFWKLRVTQRFRLGGIDVKSCRLAGECCRDDNTVVVSKRFEVLNLFASLRV